MCLDTVTKRYAKPDAKVRRAWKVFFLRGRSLVLPCVSAKIARGAWLKASNRFWYMSARYPAGFHCYAAKRGTALTGLAYDIALPVRVRGVHTEGMEGKSRVLVADELYIPTEAELKRKPKRKAAPKRKGAK